MEILNENRSGWIQTYTGIAFYPMQPRPEEIDVIDIAHALSMLCRFAGHVERFYSIAEHCVHIHDWIEDEYKFAALMHDSSEAYLVDIPKPVKNYLNEYVLIEKNLEAAIFAKYNIPYPFHPRVKEGDNRILIDERNALLKKPPMLWNHEPEPLGIKIQNWSPEVAKEQFLDRFNKLYIKKDTNE